MTQKRRLFKGGPPWLNSGGRGPDDYVLKPIEGGQWHVVIFRWGRNWTGSKEAVDSDKEAMDKIFPVVQIHTAANATVYGRLKKSGRLEKMTISATDFWEKYGDEGKTDAPAAKILRGSAPQLAQLKNRVDQIFGMKSVLGVYDENFAHLKYYAPNGQCMFFIDIQLDKVSKSWQATWHSPKIPCVWDLVSNAHKVESGEG